MYFMYMTFRLTQTPLQLVAGARRRIQLKEKNALKQTTLFKLHVQNSKTETKTIQNVVWID